MPFGKEPAVRKVKVAKTTSEDYEDMEPPEPKEEPEKEPEEEPEEEPDPLFVKGAKEPPRRPLPSIRGSAIINRPEPKHEEFVLAETRVARPTDGKRKKDDDDPAEILGMAKIGALPKGEPLEAPKKEEPPQPEETPAVPEPIIEEAIQEDTFEEEPDAKLPPPPIPPGAKEVKPPADLHAEELEGKEHEIEYEEVAVGRDGRKMKVMRLKPSKLPPAPAGDDGPEPMHAGPSGSGGIKDLSEARIERPPPGGRVRRSAGLGLDVELDDEAIRKLSAPLLPAEFSYPNRAFHSRFRRYVIFMILPVCFLVIIVAYNIVNPVTVMLVLMMFLVLLAALFIYGISPFYSGHTVTKTTLILKHGVYFEARIPIENVRTVQVYEGIAGMMGIRADRDHKLYVLSDKKEMVDIVLREPMTIAGHRGIESIITNVEMPPSFVKTVKSALSARAEETYLEER